MHVGPAGPSDSPEAMFEVRDPAWVAVLYQSNDIPDRTRNWNLSSRAVGKGHFAKVYKATNVNTKTVAAIKKLEKLTEDQLMWAAAELQIMLRVDGAVAAAATGLLVQDRESDPRPYSVRVQRQLLGWVPRQVLLQSVHESCSREYC